MTASGKTRHDRDLNGVVQDTIKIMVAFLDLFLCAPEVALRDGRRSKPIFIHRCHQSFRITLKTIDSQAACYAGLYEKQ